ncbi:inner membrane transport protein YdiM [Salmonella enterica subsp. enterica]|uniref:Inner membrane transport protein YdiM n=1 Tax=Salmonella enterica I TaxID=59201 RepID=A0A379WB22_SALET|nr:inner membrane transport protein YdiM [Salmonella enterica subsp. enterica]
MWFGWSFLLAGAIMLINALFLFTLSFSTPILGRILKPKISQAPVTGVHHCSLIDLISYTLYGYISMATFYLISQWLAQYGQFVAGMSYTQSIKLLSIYTCGSLTLRFYYRPAGQKNNSLYHIIDVLYLYLFYCASDGSACILRPILL